MHSKKTDRFSPVSTRHMHCCLEIELDESLGGDIQGDKCVERFIDEACVELNGS